MSQKASKYVFRGQKDSKSLFKGNRKMFLKHFIFSMASLIGKLFFLSFPLFALAEHHMVKQLEDTETINLEKAFEDSSSNKKYWATAQFALIHQIILIIGVLIIAGLAFGGIQLGIIIDELFLFDRYYTAFILLVISGCTLIVFAIQKSVYFGPVVYLIQSSDAMGVSDALHQSALIMTKNSKSKLLYIHLYYLIRLTLYAVALALLLYVAFLLFSIQWVIVITVILSILLLKSIPKIMLSHKISTSRLFKDLVTEASYNSLIERNKYSAFSDKFPKEELLKTLFDKMSVDEKGNDMVKKGDAHAKGLSK